MTLFISPPNNMNLELNISCPNTDEDIINNNLNKFINDKRTWCSIKLSPYTDMKLIDTYYNKGFRQFHCCGRSLLPYTSKLVKQIKNKYPDSKIIAGGGIRTINTLHYYKTLGTDHYSVSTLLFNPFKFMHFYYNYLNIIHNFIIFSNMNIKAKNNRIP